MSFITKRERVFNEYDPYDLPSRNEGKIKAHGSCTDNRAWSHFGSDKTEHLVDIIKRNNDICRPKYIPTEVIVNTLTRAKNAEISRLKRRIEECEQLIAVYDQLDLSPEQKAEIVNAHDSIKEAYKDLDELGLTLDLSFDASDFTEGVDSDMFETGKSRGIESGMSMSERGTPVKDGVVIIDRQRIDSIDKPRTDSIGKQRLDSIGKPRIDSSGRDIPRRKGDGARISATKGAPVPWSYDTDTADHDNKRMKTDSSCCCDASTNAEDKRLEELQAVIVSKDAKLNAMQNTLAVMENDVCEPYCIYAHIYTALEKIFGVLRQNDKYKTYIDLLSAGKDTRDIDITGRILFKLKILEKFSLALLAPCTQDESMKKKMCRCYDKIVSRVETAFAIASDEGHKMALDNKRAQLVADIMQNEEMKEMFSSESVSIEADDEGERPGVQSFEGENYDIETENLKRLKDLQQSYEDLMNCYEDLKHEKTTMFVKLEKYKDVELELEKMQGQLKEYCHLWHEKEHYKKRSQDLDYLKEQYIVLTDETSSLESQLKAEGEINGIKNRTIDELRNCNLEMEQKLNDVLLKFEREKNLLMCKLNETECKCMCQEQQIKTLSTQMDNLLEHNDSKFLSEEAAEEIESLTEQINNLKEVILSNEEEKQNIHTKYQQDIETLQREMENWKHQCNQMIQRNELLTLSTEEKAQEINKLSEALESKKSENISLYHELNSLKQSFHSNLSCLENEKLVTQHSLELAKQESLQLMEKVKCFDELLQKKEELKKSFESEKIVLEQENSVLRNYNIKTVGTIKELEEERNQLKETLEARDDKVKALEDRLAKLDHVTSQFKNLQSNYEQLLQEKNGLERQLFEKSNELVHAFDSIEVVKKESNQMLQQSESLKGDIEKINEAYRKSLIEKQDILEILSHKDKELGEISNTLNDALAEKTAEVDNLRKELEEFKAAYQKIVTEKDTLQKKYEVKNEEANNLNNKIKDFEDNAIQAKHFSDSLKNDNTKLQDQLTRLKRESEALSAKLDQYANLEKQYEDLDRTFAQEKNNFQQAIESLESENLALIRHSEDMENALIQSKNEAEIYAEQNEQLSKAKKHLEDMENEKRNTQNYISQLLDKSEISDNIISNYSEEIQARDNSINILNHNKKELEDTIKQLQADLKHAIEKGQEIQQSSYETIEMSKKNVEAHHSKAVHNMSLELAKLRTENMILEERLSNDMMDSEQSLKDTQRYLSDKRSLENEREIIVCQIKQLELACVGSSDLSPDHCNTEQVLGSLRRTETMYESLLSKLQTTSQLVGNKADEAQRIAEKEKYKISKEKEEALKQKQQLEQEVTSLNTDLANLKQTLKDQMSKDLEKIEGLKSELLNQQLIVDKINTSTQIYTDKLKDDLHSLQDTYESCLKTVDDLQQKNLTLCKDNDQYKKLIEDLKKDLERQTKEIKSLEQNIQELQVKHKNDACIQSDLYENNKDNETQTDENKAHAVDKHSKFTFTQFDTPLVDKYKKKFVQNKVQVLRADLSPEADFVKNSYNKSQDHSQSYTKVPMISHKGSSENMSYSDEDINSADHNKIFRENKHKIIDKSETPMKESIENNNLQIENPVPNKYQKKPVGNNYQQDDNPVANIYQQNDNPVANNYQENENAVADNLFMIYRDSKSSHKSNTDNSLKSNVRIGSEFKKKQNEPLKIKKETKYISNEDNSVKTEPLVSSKYGVETNTVNTSSSLAQTAQSDMELIYRDSINESPSLPSISHRTVPKKVTKMYNREPKQIDKVSKYSSDTNVPRANNDRVNKKVDPSELMNIKHQKTTKPRQKTLKGNTESDQNQKLSRVNANLSIFGIDPSNNDTEQNIFDTDLSMTHISTYDLDSKPHISIRSHSIDDIDNLSSKLDQQRTYPNTQTKSVMAKLDHVDDYEKEIERLKIIQQNQDRDYKKKMEAIKMQYDHHIKNILTEHKQGVSSLQNLHEETLEDILKTHENEADNLRSMSIEAMKKADKLEKENRALKYNKQDLTCLDEEPIKIMSESKKRKHKIKNSTLTKSEIQKLVICPKPRSVGPCTCSIDVNVSETIRKIFEQADLDKTKNDEHSYLRFIATKLLNENIDALDAQELSFLHLKVCRTWKHKLSKEEALQKKIDCLEMELIKRQRFTQNHIAELDRQVAEERRRLEEVREAVCKGIPSIIMESEIAALNLQSAEEKVAACTCNTPTSALPQQLGGRRSAGDLMARPSRPVGVRSKRRMQESNRAVLAKLDAEERREKRLYDEQPVRLRKSTPDRPATRLHKK